MNAGDLLGPGGVNAHDSGVGERASQNLAPEHSRKMHVGSVYRLAGNFIGAFLSDYGLAYYGIGSNQVTLLASRMKSSPSLHNEPNDSLANEGPQYPGI
jgi:hypothetical protein